MDVSYWEIKKPQGRACGIKCGTNCLLDATNRRRANQLVLKSYKIVHRQICLLFRPNHLTRYKSNRFFCTCQMFPNNYDKYIGQD